MVGEASRVTREHVEDAALDFDRMVDLHQGRIYRLALALTGHHHDAEDLAQQTFLKAYQGLNGFRGESSLGSWLYRIAVNTHVDGQRGLSEAARRTQRSWDDEHDFVSPPAERRAAGNPEKQAEAAKIQRHIEWALQRLAPRQRAVFVLRHYQQLKLREIASVLDVSEGTVKAVLFRAIRRLREELSFYRPELGLKETS